MAANTETTRERVLAQAAKLFAERGFRATTVAEICRLAHANIASVNYHFGSKQALYQLAWSYAHARSLANYPPDGGVMADASPEDRLRGRIRSLLQRALCDEGLEFRIMGHELANPTGLLRQVLHDTLSPIRQATRAIIAELVGDAADDRVLEWCDLSVIGPCLHVVHRRHMHPRRPADHGAPATRAIAPDQLDAMVAHFCEFALAGLARLRQSLSRGASSSAAREQGRS